MKSLFDKIFSSETKLPQDIKLVGSSITSKFQADKHPEIFIGLVGPLGVDLKVVSDELSSILQEVGYEAEIIKLTKILSEDEIKKVHGQELKLEPEYERLSTYINAGNMLRKNSGRLDILSLLAVAQIRERRKQAHQSSGNYNKKDPKTFSDIYVPRKAYILWSFKNKEEIKTLKDIYGSSFFVISAYSPKDKRRENLAKRISASEGNASASDKANHLAEKLIHIDYDEENGKHGQSVSSAFPLADLFIEVEDTKTKLISSLKRFVHTLFGYPYHTPTKNEFGMFLAFSVALRSADLSRQVGAAILDNQGDLIAIGCNEVPKSGGGQYWEDDIETSRDFEVGYDSSHKMKKELIIDTIYALKKAGIVSDLRSAHDITDDILTGNLKEEFKNKDINNLLEFGRMVHAEMAAITDAAKRGISLQGATIYCTTFPCHMCARHIIAAGITKVIYVEPYPKSKAQKLYPDSIAVDPSNEVTGKVLFEPFVGISPYRFHDFFSHGKIKDDHGERLKWLISESAPKIKIYNSMSYIIHETDAVGMTSSIIKKFQK